MPEINNYAVRNWLITPAALAVGQAPPSNIGGQSWLLILSGVNVIDFKGSSASQWRWMTFTMSPDTFAPLNYAVQRYGIPRPPESFPVFEVEQWAHFASLNAIYDAQQSVDAGFAVDSWRMTPFHTELTEVPSGRPLDRVFKGIDVDVAARDVDAYLYRVGYNISMLGRIVFARAPVIP